MLHKLLFLGCVFSCLFTLAQSQSSENLKEINEVWSIFYKAFDSLDHRFMAEIHAKDLVRISGGQRISSYQEYIDSYQSNFKKLKSAGETRQIELRFFERISNDSVASERGVYRLKVTNSNGKEAYYYGQFHVLLRKINGEWKIVMDYDSNENNTIGEDQFNEAQHISNINFFIEE